VHGVSRDVRATYNDALRTARESAFEPGEFVGQESFMRAAEISALAREAGITADASVLDLCCGVAGPGRFITREFGCSYLGVDADAGAIEVARAKAGDLPCRFVVARVPPLPDGSFDVVLLLETMLAFREKEPLLAAVAGALAAGGRFAFTLEEGLPLTGAEREQMPGADTVWLTPLGEMVALLERVGLAVRRQADHTDLHRAAADALRAAFAADAAAIAAQIGRRALDDLLVSHRLWSDWMREGRVRKIAVVAENGDAPA
jgi:SAM-dependent methyltransferase